MTRWRGRRGLLRALHTLILPWWVAAAVGGEVRLLLSLQNFTLNTTPRTLYIEARKRTKDFHNNDTTRGALRCPPCACPHVILSIYLHIYLPVNERLRMLLVTPAPARTSQIRPDPCSQQATHTTSTKGHSPNTTGTARLNDHSLAQPKIPTSSPEQRRAKLCSTALHCSAVTSHGASRARSFSDPLLLFSSRFFIVLLFFRAAFVLREQSHLQSSARGLYI